MVARGRLSWKLKAILGVTLLRGWLVRFRNQLSPMPVFFEIAIMVSSNPLFLHPKVRQLEVNKHRPMPWREKIQLEPSKGRLFFSGLHIPHIFISPVCISTHCLHDLVTSIQFNIFHSPVSCVRYSTVSAKCLIYVLLSNLEFPYSVQSPIFNSCLITSTTPANYLHSCIF